jgi:hypothetical protein
MIRKRLESVGIKVSDQEFIEGMGIVTDDIRENRIKFNKKTSIEQLLIIALRTFFIMKKYVPFDTSNLCNEGR